MLAFIRKSKKRFYLFAFITLMLWFLMFDYFMIGSFNFGENLLRAVIFVTVYAFIDWALKGYKKKKRE